MSIGLLSLVFAGGLLWTSLLNGFAHRLLKERALLGLRARCASCDAELAWYDLIPLISHIMCRGRCRGCATPSSLLYPLVELLGACIFTGLWYTRTCDYGNLWTLGLSMDVLFAGALVVALRTDLEEMVILRVSSLYLIPIWFVCAAFGLLNVSLLQSFVGACMGYLLPWCAGRLYMALRGTDGIGVGDFELLAMIGAFLGTIKMLDSLMIACVVAIVIGLGYAIISRDRMVRIPFAPFLALGALIELFR